MSRKYYSDEFEKVPKPRIIRVNKQYGLVVYSWLCACTTGSRGYGTTKEHAYYQWLRNWKRRQRWYTR